MRGEDRGCHHFRDDRLPGLDPDLLAQPMTGYDTGMALIAIR